MSSCRIVVAAGKMVPPDPGRGAPNKVAIMNGGHNADLVNSQYLCAIFELGKLSKDGQRNVIIKKVVKATLFSKFSKPHFEVEIVKIVEIGLSTTLWLYS